MRALGLVIVIRAKRTIERVDVVEIVGHLLECVIVVHYLVIDSAHLILAQLDKKDRSGVDDTFEHSDRHDDKEDGKHANFERRWLLCHL